MAGEQRQGLGGCNATDPLQAMHKLLRLAKFRAEVVALAAHGFNQTRWPQN
jgi:hypothetical protein